MHLLLWLTLPLAGFWLLQVRLSTFGAALVLGKRAAPAGRSARGADGSDACPDSEVEPSPTLRAAPGSAPKLRTGAGGGPASQPAQVLDISQRHTSFAHMRAALQAAAAAPPPPPASRAREGAGAAHVRQQRGQAQALERVQRRARTAAVHGRRVRPDLVRGEARQALLPGALRAAILRGAHCAYARDGSWPLGHASPGCELAAPLAPCRV